MRTLDFITPVVACGLDRQLRGGPPIRMAWFDDFVKPPASLEFRDGNDAQSLEEWAGALAATGARLTYARPGDRMLAGFAGPSGLLLAIAKADGAFDLYQPGEAFPRRTLLEVPDILGFVDAFARRDELLESILWEAEHNLDFPAGVTWEDFVAALQPRDAERVTDALDRCFSNVKFEVEWDVWQAFVHRHENPDYGPIFRFARLEPVAELPDAPALAPQTARLVAAVRSAAQLAAKHELKDWADHFNKVVGTLTDAPVDDSPLVRTLEACGLEEPRVRLVIGTFYANVFGGMGSWNDLPIADDEYDRVSEELFRELHPSMVAAVSGTA